MFEGNSGDRKGVHYVGWDVLCRAKERGGLGLKRTAEMNKALLAKLAWRVVSQGDASWAKVIRYKYGLEEDGPLQFKLKQRSLLIWKGIV